MADVEVIRMKVFRTGGSLAVRLPARLGFSEGAEVVALKLPQGILLHPATATGWPPDYFESWPSLDLRVRGAK